MEPLKKDGKWGEKVIMICLMIIAGIYQVNIGVV